MTSSVVASSATGRLPTWEVMNWGGTERHFGPGIYHPILLESRANLRLRRTTPGADHQNHLPLRFRPFCKPLVRSLSSCCCQCSAFSSPSAEKIGVVAVGKANVSSKDHGNEDGNKNNANAKSEPLALRLAVSGVTQLLRVFNRNDDSSSESTRGGTGGGRSSSLQSSSSSSLSSASSPSISADSELEEVRDWSSMTRSLVDSLREDYARSYFLSGDFTDALYSENCYFADPTVQFSGRDLYKRNLKLLVPFYEDPSLTLDDIGEVVDDGESVFIVASWRLRVYLNLPWKPFVAIDGSTRYSLGADARIIKHVESWNVTGIQAIGQLFRPSERAFWKKGPNGRTKSRP